MENIFGFYSYVIAVAFAANGYKSVLWSRYIFYKFAIVL